MTTPQPNLPGFVTFVFGTMGVPKAALPANSPFLAYAFANALAIVNPALECIPIPSQDAAGNALNSGGWTIYAEAVYNLAADNLVNYAPDQPGESWFADLRDKLKINAFVSGVVQSSSDEGTAVSLVVQEAAKNFTLGNLQNLKTPWGRRYLALAQDYGPSTWGIS